MPAHPSRCSAGTALTMVWAGIPVPLSTAAIESVLSTFEALVRTSVRNWDIREWAMVKAEFKSRIVRACAGHLIPLDQVKEIDRGRAEYVFEIKHDFVHVNVDLTTGSRTKEKVCVRLYISEPPTEPAHFVALHMHEKTKVPTDHGEENRLQNIEIDIAVRYYELGRPSNWGI